MDLHEALVLLGAHELAEVIPRPAWHADALCIDLPRDDLFYPERRYTADGRLEGPANPKAAVAEAREVCGRCPVRGPCLAWALANDEHGVWAGTTREERRAMRRQAA